MSPQNRPSGPSVIQKIDFWLLDRVFQPMADRLPERWSALKVGMNLQLGSLVFAAASLIMLIMLFKMPMLSILSNILGWFLGSLFYFAIHRMTSMVRIGFLNPFRFMLSGVRVISIPFAIYSIYLGITADAYYQEAMLLNSISNSIFVFGLYLISCQPTPPPEKRRQNVFSMNELS